MTSFRKFSLVLLVVAALVGIMASPAQAQPSPNCNTGTFPAQMILGNTYTLTCNASGGSGGYNWTISAGSIPAGMTPNTFSGGEEFNVTGVASFAATYTFTVTVTDSSNASGSQQISVTVAASTGVTPSGTISLTQVTPNLLTAGQSVTLTLYGANFTGNTQVHFNGTVIPSTFYSSSQITAIPPPYLVTAGNVPVYVTDATNGTSLPQNVAVQASATGGSLSLISLTPPSVPTGSGAFTLTLNGTGFYQGLDMTFGSIGTLGTNFISSTELQVSIPAAWITTAQTINVSVGGSNAVQFTIGGTGTSGGIITLSSVYPTTLTPGAATSIQLNGSYFTPNTQVYFNNTQVSSTYQNSSTFLTASIPGYLITAGALPVYVIDPSNGRSQTVYVNTGATGTINLSSLSQTTFTPGTSPLVYFYGSNFTVNSVIHVGNTQLAVNFVSSGQVYQTIPASLLISGTTLPVYISDPNNGTSNVITVTVTGLSSTGGGLSISTISPSNASVGASPFTLTILGTGFSSGVDVTFGNVCTLATNFVSSNELTANIPTSCVATAGTLNVSVGGSNQVPFTITGGSTGNLTVFCNPSAGPTTINTAYSQSCSVSGGVAPYTWTISGLPAGLSGPNTGTSTVTISGTPYSVQSYAYSVQVTDSSSTRLTGTLTITGTISSGSTPGYSISSISPSTIPAGSAATSITVTGSGFTSGSEVFVNGTEVQTTYQGSTQLTAVVPASTLAYAATVSVTVYTTGVYTNAVSLTVGSGSVTTSGNLTVTCSPGVGPQTVSTQFSTICTASGGTQPYTWPTPAGLPGYLTLSGTSGPSITISGTPSSAGPYNFTVKVTDSSSPILASTLQIAGQVNATNTNNNGTLTVTSLSPTSAATGSSAVSLTVSGSGFVSNSTVIFNGFPIVTTFVSANELIATIPSGLLTYPTAAQVQVTTTGVGTSNGLTFTVGNGVAVQISITCNPGVGPSVPNSYYAGTCSANGGTGPYTWSIIAGSLPTGLTFSPNGVYTSIGGYTTLNGPYNYTIQATDSSFPPNVATAVFAGTTGLGSGASGGLSISSITPTSIAPGTASTTLTVNGVAFTTTSTVYFNTTALATTFVNSGELTAVIPSNLLITPTTASITVNSTGVTSNSVSLTIGTGPSSGVTLSCSPSAGPPSPGTNYTSTCTATGGKAPFAWGVVNGILPSGLVLGSSNSSTDTISGIYFLPGGSVNPFAPYNYTVQVTDSSTPPQTATFQFEGSIGASAGGFGGTISSLNPSSAPVGGSQFTLTVTGTGFQSGGVSFVVWGGTPLLTTYISPTQLSAIVPASLLTNVGTFNVTVQSNGLSTNQVGFFVSGGAALTVSPASVSFTYALGGIIPPARPVSITSVTSSITGFSVSFSGSIANNVTWLTASPTSGVLPGSINIIVAPAGLPLGTYTGTVTITGFGAGGGVNIPVSLVVQGAPSLVSSVTPVNFTAAAGNTAPSQTLNITASDGQSVITYNVAATSNNGGNWLSVSPSSGTTPGTVTVSANATSLGASTYSGQLTFTPTGSIGSVYSVPVNFTVTAPVTLTAAPTTLTFNAVSGQSNPAAQSIAVSAGGSTASNYTVAATATGGNWLSVSPASGTTPGSISVSANISGLATGSYTGTVTITDASATNSPLTVPVTLTVSAPPALTASPTSLTFNFQSGGTAPASQSLSITAPTGSSAVFSFTAAASTANNQNWLSVSPTTGSTPGSVSVSVSTGTMALGTYTGTVTITATGAGPLTVPVTLNITAPPVTLSVSPATLTFNVAAAAPSPAAQTISVTAANNATASYTVTTSSSGNWLNATASGTTPGTISVSVGSSTLAIGQYTGTVTISSTGATNSPQTVQVTLNITAPASISVAPQSLSFFVPGDGSTPAPQTVTVFSTTTGNTNFTATAFAQGGNWLTVSGGGTTPGSVIASVNPAGLAPGQTYNGSITISAPGSTPSSQQVAVTLTVAQQGAVPLQAAPSALYLSYNQGAGTDLQHFLVLNPGGGSVNYTVQGGPLGSSGANCGNWLNVVTPAGTATASTPGIVAFTVNPSGLNSQTCPGIVTVNNVTGGQVAVPVYMAISAGTESIVLSQTAMNFVASATGSAPAAQTFQVLNPGTGSMAWSISTSTLSGGSWLSANPNSGTSLSLGQPSSPINVTVNAQGLAAGIYYGTVQITSTGAVNAQQSITVSLTVLASGTNPPAQVSPAGVILTGVNGSANTQAVNVTNTGSASLSYSAILSTDDGQSWLTASPTSGSIAAGSTNAINLSATVSSLGTGLRHGTMRLAFSNGTVQTVDVQLAVAGTASGITGVRACGTSNLALEFLSPQQNFQAAAQVATPVQVLVQDCNGNMLTESNTGVDVLVGNSGADIHMTYTGNGVWAGTWTPVTASSAATLTAQAIELVGASAATGVITANGTTGAAAPNAPPLITSVVNAGSFLFPGLIAPGTMVTIFGSSLADGQSQVFSTPFPNTLEGAQFSIAGMKLPVFYASSTQVNAVMPIGLTPDVNDQLTVVRDTTQSAPVNILVADQTPGVFTVNSQGTGQAAALVGGTAQIAAPSGSIPGANAAPATAGQTLSFFLAGMGMVSNPPADGSPSTGTSLTTATPTVNIGGAPAQVTYSGLAPGEVGLYQLNVVVPAGAMTGPVVPVLITIGNEMTSLVSIALQ